MSEVSKQLVSPNKKMIGKMSREEATAGMVAAQLQIESVRAFQKCVEECVLPSLELDLFIMQVNLIYNPN